MYSVAKYYTNRKGRVYNCPPPAGSPRFARGTAWGAWVRFPLLAGGTLRLKGVGFFSRGWHGGRDARVPSVARAGNASVSLAWRQKCPAQ